MDARVLEVAPYPVVLFEGDSRISRAVAANPAARRLFAPAATNADEALERVGRALLVAPLAEAVRQALGRAERFEGELEQPSDDGLRRVMAHVAPLEPGRAVVFLYDLAAAEDDTERRRLERRFAESRRLESLGRLAAGVAHDFNDVLTVILGAVDLLATTAELGPDPARALALIRSAGQHAGDLTKIILALVRDPPMEPAVLAADELLWDVHSLVRRHVGEPVEVVVDANAQGAHVLVDGTRLLQVLLDVVANARDAMTTGGRIVLASSVETYTSENVPPRSDVGLGAYVALRIDASSARIGEDVLRQVLDPIGRKKRRNKPGGIGLGAVPSLLADHGGHVVVRGVPGQGTSMLILLPRVPRPGPAAVEAPLRATRPGTTVLVVEDELLVRRVARDAFAELGFRVLEASHGLEALALVRSEEVVLDLVVTDVVMPILDGPTFVRELRARHPSLPVLVVSGQAKDERLTALSADENVAFLQKPYTGKTLVRRALEMLDAKKG